MGYLEGKNVIAKAMDGSEKDKRVLAELIEIGLLHLSDELINYGENWGYTQDDYNAIIKE